MTYVMEPSFSPMRRYVTEAKLLGAGCVLASAFLATLGVVPYWPGLSGHVPVFVYPLGVLCFTLGCAGVAVGVWVWRSDA